MSLLIKLEKTEKNKKKIDQNPHKSFVCIVAKRSFDAFIWLGQSTSIYALTHTHIQKNNTTNHCSLFNKNRLFEFEL